MGNKSHEPFTSTTVFQSDFSFVRESANEQTPEETTAIMAYEYGEFVKNQHYFKRYGGGYYENQFKELGDLTCMIRMYCEQRGKSFQDIIRLGEECYKERMDDLKGYGKNDQLKPECRRVE